MVVAEASSAAAATGAQLRRWYQTSGVGSPAQQMAPATLGSLTDMNISLHSFLSLI